MYFALEREKKGGGKYGWGGGQPLEFPFLYQKSTVQMHKNVRMPVVSEEENQVVGGKGYKEEFHSILFVTFRF